MAVFFDPHADTAPGLRDDSPRPRQSDRPWPRPLAHPELAAASSVRRPCPLEQVCQAFDRGLDVLCEKPLAGRRMEISDLIDRQQHSGRILSVAIQRRYKAPYATARRDFRNAPRSTVRAQIHVFVLRAAGSRRSPDLADDPAVGRLFRPTPGKSSDRRHFVHHRLASRVVLAISDRRGSRVEIVIPCSFA